MKEIGFTCVTVIRWVLTTLRTIALSNKPNTYIIPQYFELLTYNNVIASRCIVSFCLLVSTYIVCERLSVMQSFLLHSKEGQLLPPPTKLGQGYVFTGMCDSVHGGGVCLSACWDTTPQSRHPPGADTPPRSRHPPLQSMLGDTVNARAVRILLECNLVMTFDILPLTFFMVYTNLSS